jgi:glycolate oxidase FAD binding subunit
MKDALRPRDAKDVEDAVLWALGESKTLEIVGRGTKRALGRPSQSDLTLDLSGLSGVTLYEPEELVLSARAGAPLAEIEALVASKGQELAFEPMDYGPVLGVSRGAGTLGGALAANLAGPRRIKSGAARDHFLGTSAVSGRGETFKSGGRVVKNVTGYDLCKVLAGSFGTLAAMTDVTIKVLPKAETEQTVMVLGLDDAAAMRAMAAAMNSSCDVSGAAHLPQKMAARLPAAPQSVTAFRIEGVAPSVTHRKQMLEALLKSFGTLSSIDETESRNFWRGVRDVLPFATDAAASADLLWRVSTAPANGAALAAGVAAKADANVVYDWAGGLVWIALRNGGDDGGAALVRGAVANFGGHATLVRAPAALRAAVDVFEPADAPVAALSRRVKQSFDPKGVLNPGRIWAGV